MLSWLWTTDSGGTSAAVQQVPYREFNTVRVLQQPPLSKVQICGTAQSISLRGAPNVGTAESENDARGSYLFTSRLVLSSRNRRYRRNGEHIILACVVGGKKAWHPALKRCMEARVETLNVPGTGGRATRLTCKAAVLFCPKVAHIASCSR